MKTLMQLRAERSDLLNQAKAIGERLGNTDELTAEELESLNTELDTLNASIEQNTADLQARADRDERVSAAAKRLGDHLPFADNVSNPRARVEDDPRRGFKNFGDLCSAIAKVTMPGQRTDDRLSFLGAASGLQYGAGADGGFLVPPEFSRQIWDGLRDDSDSLLPMTDQHTIDGESLTIPANAETSRADGSRYGGIQGFWKSEIAQMTSSKPKFRQMRLEPQQLYVLVFITDKLLQFPTGLQEYVGRAARDEIAFLTNNAIINGTGVGQPKGILNSNGKVSVAKETNQTADTVVFNNIVKMWSRMHRRARAGAVWFINQDVETQLMTMAFNVGTGGVPAYMPPTGLSASPYATLMGRPVIPIEYAPALGDEGDIIFANMSYYATGMRRGIDEAMSMHLRFDYAETAFRFIFEIDGQPWIDTAITPKNSTNTRSPFVTLAARA